MAHFDRPIQLSKGIDYISDLKSLLDNDFYQYSKDNVFYEFKRLIFKTQAFITENENKDIAIEYYHTVKVMNLERKLQNDGKRYRELITFFEPSNEK